MMFTKPFVALSLLVSLTSAAPLSSLWGKRQNNRGGKNVQLFFEVGGRTEVLHANVRNEQSCVSVASGGTLVALRSPKDVACRLRDSGCNDQTAAVSPPMSGEVNLNGSGELAMYAQFARSVECSPNNRDESADIVEIGYSIGGEPQPDVSISVGQGGCLSLPQTSDISITKFNIGSQATCQLATDCTSKQSIGQELKGDVDLSKNSVQQQFQQAGALKCSSQ